MPVNIFATRAQVKSRWNVRLWHKADMLAGRLNVRFPVQSGPSAGETREKENKQKILSKEPWGWVTAG